MNLKGADGFGQIFETLANLKAFAIFWVCFVLGKILAEIGR